MPNANTDRSRSLRAASSKASRLAIIESGGRNISVTLSPESTRQLAELQEKLCISGTKAAIEAAIRLALDSK